MPLNWSSGIVRIFGGASLAGAFSSACLALSDQYTPPARPARTITAISSPLNFTANASSLIGPRRYRRGSESSESPAFPPDHQACRNYDQRQSNHARRENRSHLATRKRQAAVFRLFGTNRNQVLIGAEPVHHVQEQVAIPVEAQNVVRYPVGAAHHHEASLFRGRLHRAGGGDGQWTLLILLRIDADFRRTQVTGGEAVVGSRKQLLRWRFDVQSARQRKGRRRFLHLAHDGVRFVRSDQRHHFAQTEDLAYAAGVDRQVLVHGDAPAFEHLIERGAIGPLFFTDLQRRIEHQQRVAAVTYVGLDRVHGRLSVLILGTGHNQDGAVGRHLGLCATGRGRAQRLDLGLGGNRLRRATEQGNGLGFVIALCQRF